MTRYNAVRDELTFSASDKEDAPLSLILLFTVKKKRKIISQFDHFQVQRSER